MVEVRKIVVAFKGDFLKTDTLKHYSKVEFGQELVLILNSKTCWNSMLDMIQRFKLKVTKSLLDFGSKKLLVSDKNYWCLIKTIGV